MGSLELRNRIVMAPLTRMRANNPEHAPTALQAEYYAPRASAGLIIGECTEVSPQGYGWADTPGLWNLEQVHGWCGVTEAVRLNGGLIYAQLWHTGAMSHPDFFGGELPVSASNVNVEQESVTPSGRKPTVAPRPMTKAEIRRTVADFANAARNAMEAGFDACRFIPPERLVRNHFRSPPDSLLTLETRIDADAPGTSKHEGCEDSNVEPALHAHSEKNAA
jgi:N-ethylmaleimide reductase